MDDTFVRSMSGIKHVQNFDGGLLCQKASETHRCFRPLAFASDRQEGSVLPPV